jgi:hypothetical protein
LNLIFIHIKIGFIRSGHGIKKENENGWYNKMCK